MKKLFEFLRKHKVLTKFKNNFKKLNHNNYDLKSYCDIVISEDQISGAFYWDETDEGSRFWLDLSIKWKATL